MSCSQHLIDSTTNLHLTAFQCRLSQEWKLDLSCEWLSATEETEALTDLSMSIKEAWLRYPGGSLEDEEGRRETSRLLSH